MAQADYIIGDAEKLLKEETRPVDAIVTDPPFKISLSKDIRGLRKPFYGELSEIVGSGEGFSISPFLELFERVCKPLVLILFSSKNELPLLLNWVQSKGLVWDLLTWHKKNPIPFTNNHFMSDTEFILYARERGAYRPVGGEFPWSKMKTYFIMDSPRRQRGRGEHVGVCAHPCTKPMPIMNRLVQLAAPRGGMILDPFAGSGTTIRAALANDRDAIGYELNPKWEALLADACETRVQNLTHFEAKA